MTECLSRKPMFYNGLRQLQCRLGSRGSIEISRQSRCFPLAVGFLDASLGFYFSLYLQKAEERSFALGNGDNRELEQIRHLSNIKGRNFFAHSVQRLRSIYGGIRES